MHGATSSPSSSFSAASSLPVIVAEIRVQRVHVETNSRGGAQQLSDHLSGPTQDRRSEEGKTKKNLIGKNVLSGSQ